MKLKGIVNADISKALSDTGHTDLICICDLGLPLDSKKRIDLSLSVGKPTFKEVLKEILEDFSVEKYFLAEEIESQNEKQLANIKQLMPDVECSYVSHEDFKKMLKDVKCVIRTGENTPYSNIILQSKNIF